MSCQHADSVLSVKQASGEEEMDITFHLKDE